MRATDTCTLLFLNTPPLDRRASHFRGTAPAARDHWCFLGAAAKRSAAGAPAATASAAAHTAPPSHALQSHRSLTRKSPSEPSGRSASPALRRPAAMEARPSERGPPTIHSNPLPSAPQLRSSPPARDHRPPTAPLRAAPGPFTAGQPESRYLSATPAGRHLTFILLTPDAAGKGRTSARTSYIHHETLARKIPSALHVTGACPMASGAFRAGAWPGGEVGGVASLRGHAPALPRARIRELGSCLEKAGVCLYFLGAPLASEKVFLRNGQWNSTQALRGWEHCRL